jgi:predicted DNA-binding protein with PD1-like motif
MRSIRQPGAPLPDRADVVPVRAEPLRLVLPAGVLLRDAVAEAVAARGFDGAVFRYGAAAFGPFAYVMPALSPDGRTAAWYSDSRRPEGVTVTECGALTLGVRDGGPFFHSHALWREASGRRSGGHLLPEACVTAGEVVLEGVGLKGARFEARPDPETGFTLFGPVPAGEAPAAPNGIALRLRPNQDLTLALEGLAARYGLGRCGLFGGVGSTIGVRWADGTGEATGFATELALTAGEIDPAGGSRIEGALVDLHGAVSAGTILRGDNPVLMTMEAVLAAV